MDDAIQLKITNISNDTYKKVVLRKFFCMFFFDANGKKLNLYIASVFGGNTDVVSSASEAYKSIKSVRDKPCTLQFDFFSSSSKEGALIQTVSVEDMTSAFLAQSGEIGNVWGSCKPLKTERERKKRLEELYGLEDVQADSQTAYFELEEKDKDKDKSHHCIVVQGNNLQREPQTKLERSNYSYTLSCPNSSPDGLEVMYWIKHTITLRKNILKNKGKIAFTIEFADPDKEPETSRESTQEDEQGEAKDAKNNNHFFTPDLTCYFAPPHGYIVNQDSSAEFLGIKEKNALQSVRDDTTVLFDEWTKHPQSIEERRKSRIRFPDDQNKETELSKSPIKVSLRLENPNKHANLQFFIGLLIAFLLSFCSDKTRVNDFFSCLKASCTCGKDCTCRAYCNSLTIIMPLLLIFAFLAIVMNPETALPKTPDKKDNESKEEERKRKKKRNCRVLFVSFFWLGVCSIALLTVYVYVLWQVFPDLMSSIHITCSLNKKILRIFYLTSFIPTVGYLGYCIWYLKRKVSNYL